MSTDDYDDFFDEEGNLTSTAWQKEREREEAEQQRKREAQRERENIREVNSRFTVEEQRIRIEKEQERIRKRRQLRDEWMLMPSWIKSMPRTPLTDPPTEGRKEKMLYSLSGKVTLTENERKVREANLSRLRVSMDDYRAMHRRLPPNTPMSPVTVVSLGDRSGGSMLVRMLSKAFSESRSDLGIYATVDFGNSTSRLSQWYGSINRARVNLRHVLSQVNSGVLDDLTIPSVFPFCGESSQSEYFLPNPSDEHRRVTPSIFDVTYLYMFMKRSEGVCFFDCSEENMDALVTCAALSTSMIFTIPLSKNAPSSIVRVMDEIKKSGIPDQVINEIRSRSYIVICGSTSKTSEPKGRKMLSALGKACIEESGINPEHLIILPYDKALSVRPLSWKSVKFSTAHIVRSLCGQLIGDALERYGESG